MKNFLFKIIACLTIVVISACLPQARTNRFEEAETVQATATAAPIQTTPLPTRPIYTAGQLVDYTAQTGDTLPALALRFNTTVLEIRKSNPIIPPDATTMPFGLPMKIPIFYQPFWSNPFEIIPDSMFINGPAQRNFDSKAFVLSKPGWLKDYEFFVGKSTLKGGELLNQVALEYSLSPRLLLAIIEYQIGALSNPLKPQNDEAYYFSKDDISARGLYRQLTWLANTLNDYYYSARTGALTSWELQNGRLERPDPWLNPATVALQRYFAHVFQSKEYELAVSGSGYVQIYRRLFGDLWEKSEAHIPGSLVQPALLLPFSAGHTWAYTGGPHTAWGSGEPMAAIDFAPPAIAGGCNPTSEKATAVADGTISRTGDAIAVLDLDGDGDERTGWVIFYLHLANNSLPSVGTKLKAGDPIGIPSCEGGRATGTHVHLARKYNGEWIPADGSLAFNLEGWIVTRGAQVYQGGLVKGNRSVRSCECSDSLSFVQAGSN